MGLGHTEECPNAAHPEYTRDDWGPTERREEGLRAYTVNVLVIPPNIEIALGIVTMHEEKRTIYGTSLADAKKRAGIE
jgi:hypothetical protein